MNAVDILKYGHSFLMNSIEGLEAPHWDTGGVCGVWSSKDIMAHLASYEAMLIEVLNGLLGISGATPMMQLMGTQGPEAFNDIEVAKRQTKSIAEVLQEYHEGHARNMQLIAQLSTEKCREVGTLPWYGLDYALDDYLVYTFYGHKREHGAQIAVFRDSLK